jgi:dienelactone hydrolase
MANRITRRALAIAAVGAAAVAQTKTEETNYHGALDGLEDKVKLPEFDSLDFTRKLYEKAPLKLTFRATSRKDAEAWQKRLRAKMLELMGGFSDRGKPPVAQVLESREFPGYTREKFMFESRPGLAVLGYALLPKTAGPHAAMVCVPGHGRGLDDIVGIDDKGRDRTDKAGYQHDYAIQAVEHGMAAIAIEPLGFGCRRDPASRKRGLTQSSCQPAAGAALLLGETMIAWRVFDIMRTIDWIETRRDLDSKRVGCMGISGGGTCTVFAAAMDPRIQMAFVSGYLNTFRDSIFSLSHCIDNYVPGVLNWAEQYDVAGLIAPRALVAESGERDPIFPIAAARESFGRVKRVYEVFGAGDKIGHEVHPEAHVFWGKQGLPFAAAQLGVKA